MKVDRRVYHAGDFKNVYGEKAFHSIDLNGSHLNIDTNVDDDVTFHSILNFAIENDDNPINVAFDIQDEIQKDRKKLATKTNYLRCEMNFPKYMEGQQISAYTNKDEIFEGYIKIKDGIHYVVNSEGVAKKLTELKKPRRIGRLLKEEAEKDWAEELKKFGDYYQNTFDTEKVEKANDDVKGKIIDEYAAVSDDNNVKNNAEDFKKDAMSIINQKASEDKIANGTSTVDNEIEQLKKTQESLFNNKKIQKAILKEAEVVAEEAANYQAPANEFGLDDTNCDYALDMCQSMIDAEETRDAIVDSLQTEFEMSKDEAEMMYDELSQDDLTWEMTAEDNDNQNEFDLYDIISDDVDKSFEDELNSCSDEVNCDSYSILEHLASKFGGDAKKAFEEAGNIYDGVLNLAEQVKMNRVNEERNKQRSK